MIGIFWVGLAGMAAAQTTPRSPPPQAPAPNARPDDGTDLVAAQRAAMARLAFMDGAWRGSALIQSPYGQQTVTQTERVGPFVGGTVKVIEGRGFNQDGSIGFNAFGIVSYDPQAKAYRFHSYAQGQEGSFAFSARADGYSWEIPAGPAVIRYTATIGPKIWHETGDRILPGSPPARFFEMTLQRIGDSDWPEAGALAPR